MGLALLLCEGMPGWLKALEGLIRASGVRRAANAAEAAPAVAEPPDAYGSAPEWLGSVPHRDLTAFWPIWFSRRVVSNSPCRRRDIDHANEQ